LAQQHNLTGRCVFTAPDLATRGDEEEGVSKCSADALSAAHGRDRMDENPEVILGTEANLE
jgi:hypothetical protein